MRVSSRHLRASKHTTTMSYAFVVEKAERPVIDLTIGQPDVKPPSVLVELLASEARGADASRYPPPQGLGELREAIASLLSEAYGVDAAPENIVVLVGAKPGIAGAVYALCDPGDAVLILSPHFYAYEIASEVLGAKTIVVKMRWERGVLEADEEEVKRVFERHRPCLTIINTPHNPTGLHASPSLLDLVADLAVEKGSAILSDEVYAWLVYRGSHEPLVAKYGTELVVHLESFSKTLAIPGWRVGFVYAEAEVVRALTFFNANIYTGVPRFIQRAVARYITDYREDMLAFVERMRRIYSKRASALLEALAPLQGLVDAYMPAAGFFLFPSVRGLEEKLGVRDSEELAGILASKAGVLTVPGRVFGDWPHHIRVSLTAPESKLREAASRIAELAARA